MRNVVYVMRLMRGRYTRKYMYSSMTRTERQNKYNWTESASRFYCQHGRAPSPITCTSPSRTLFGNFLARRFPIAPASFLVNSSSVAQPCEIYKLTTTASDAPSDETLELSSRRKVAGLPYDDEVDFYDSSLFQNTIRPLYLHLV